MGRQIDENEDENGGVVEETKKEGN